MNYTMKDLDGMKKLLNATMEIYLNRGNIIDRLLYDKIHQIDGMISEHTIDTCYLSYRAVIQELLDK